MKTSKFTYGIFCLIAVTGFAGVGMTQEDQFNTEADWPDSNQYRDEPRSVGPPSNGFSNSNQRRQNVPVPRNSQQFFDLEENVRRHPNADRQVFRSRMRSRTVMESYLEPVPPEEIEESRLLQTAIQSLNDRSSDADKKKASDVIQEQLKRQFERDLKQREKELAAVEKRVLKLRQQLDKRKAAQKDIINLRLQTLVNEANGLGFPAHGFGGSTISIHDPISADLDRFPPASTGDAFYDSTVPAAENSPASRDLNSVSDSVERGFERSRLELREPDRSEVTEDRYLRDRP